MKLHIDTENKTVAMEGDCKVSAVFNYLMSWFPEEWEKWTFITNWEPTIYKEVIVSKEVYRNPYWNPWDHSSAINAINTIPNPSFTTSLQATLNFNTI